GMVQWSPETTRGDATRAAAPGGYAYDARRVRGFSLTHLSGTGCRGASGDVPFMPHGEPVASSPAADRVDQVYAERFSHANETARAGSYRVVLESGIAVELAATARTGAARFSFPAGKPAALLIRVSDSEAGSGDAEVTVDAAARTVTGAVTSGNFCGYLDAADRRSYYTLHFVAVFDRPFASAGTWEDGALKPGATAARGGTTYGDDGYPVAGKGSGAWVEFAGAAGPGAGPGADPSAGPGAGVRVGVRVGISYVSAANAAANLQAENPPGTTFEEIARRAHEAWDRELHRIEVGGGTHRQRTSFYTALYHSLLHPNLFSDVDGQYPGFDGQVHTVAGRQRAQYANFSGWDVYRSQLQLVTLLEPAVAADVAQSLLEQASQNGGEWDRWTHNSGATHVMAGDPAAPAIAGIVAFGGGGFDVASAFASLARAATVPTAHDLAAAGCPVECSGQRPALDRWLAIHYVPAGANAWGGAGETLEDAIADFSLAQLARRLGDEAAARRFLTRSGSWRNVWNPRATAAGGYVQDRNADGSWPAFDPASGDGFAEGSSAQYTWMVPFDVRGLFDAMGGDAQANRRLDAFFHDAGGGWALTGLGGTHAELDNEPSIGAPWLYLFSGMPYRTQQTVRQALDRLWSDLPYGIPGNDDLGEMSSWYVWSAMGMYPGIPGRAELLLASPLFPSIVVRRANGPVLTIAAPRAGAGAPYVRRLRVDGVPSTRPWLPESFAAYGGRLDYDLSSIPDVRWGSAPGDAPPSFPPTSR
ncbi:MAG TPA: GH92 family glycosyl hydrolase, partial [Thermoanaerobaculia bacterium]